MRQTEIIWALAHMGPATVKEVESFLGYEEGEEDANSFTRAWRSGFLVRRRRETGTIGSDPYEYAIAPAE